MNYQRKSRLRDFWVVPWGMMAILMIAFHQQVGYGFRIERSDSIKCGEWVDLSIRFGRSMQDKSSVNNKGRTGRIRTGLPASPGEVPFQVNLMQDGRFHCGGVVIEERTILTAAHCIGEVRDPKRYKVAAGDYNISVQDGERLFDVKQIIVHEKFDKHSLVNDIAILKLKQTMSWYLNKLGLGSINRVCMPKQKDLTYQVGEKIQVSGWGMNENLTSSDVLYSVGIQILDLLECKKFDQQMDISRFCSENIDDKGPYFGDSGGPLFRSVSGRNELVGLVSEGRHDPCRERFCKPLYYIHTRVSHYIDWIRKSCRCKLSFI